VNRSVILKLGLVFLILVTLHYALRPVMYWRTPIDFVLIGCLIVAVRVRPGVAAVVGFSVGLLVGVQSPGSMGSAAMALAGVAYAASFLKASVFADRPAMNTFMFFGGKWVYDIVFLLVEGDVLSSAALTQIFVWSVLAAVVTAIAGAATLALARPLLADARR
jgi:rod shape-determining protein MreD